MAINNKRARHSGFTLLEIITTVVVIAVAAPTLMSVFSSTIQTSADPMFQHQALSIAEAYMEEILLKDFTIGPETCYPARKSNSLGQRPSLPQGHGPDHAHIPVHIYHGLNGVDQYNGYLRVHEAAA